VANSGHATAIAGPWVNTVSCEEVGETQRAREMLGFVPQTSAVLSAVIAHQRAGRPRWGVTLTNRRAVANNMIYTLNIKCVGGAYLEEPFERTNRSL
jgi:hypothetical protein